jgi:hypothetical protein
MYLLKVTLVFFCVLSFSSNIFAQDAQESEDPQEKIAGEKSHNGVTQKMTPEEVEKKMESKKKLKLAKKALKADGKYSKDDRKEIRKMKKSMKSANVAEPKKEVSAPGKDTQQMIEEADAETDDESAD